MSWIARLSNKQLLASQDRRLERLLDDPEFARRAATEPMNVCLGELLPQTGGKKVLELGCGPGKFVALLSSLGFEVVGVDPIPFPTWDVIRKKTNAVLTDKVFAESLPFPDQTFDHVVCLGAILYFDDPQKALLEIRRVVKPGGTIVLRTVNKNNLYTLATGRKLDPASKHLFSMEELTDLTKRSGLEVKKAFSYGFWPPAATNLWWYLQNVWLTDGILDRFSSWTSPKHHINNIICASRPA